MGRFFTFNIWIATILLSGSSFEVSAQWGKYVDPGFQFEILMPDTVVVSKTQSETPVGMLEYVSFVSFATGMSGNAHYVISYCHYPEGTLHEDSTDLVNMFFEETIAGAVESIGGELMYQDEVTVDSHPGLLWKVKSDATKLHVKSKALIVDNTYYCMQVSTSEAHSLRHDGEKFFNSFKLLRR